MNYSNILSHSTMQVVHFIADLKDGCSAIAAFLPDSALLCFFLSQVPCRDRSGCSLVSAAECGPVQRVRDFLCRKNYEGISGRNLVQGDIIYLVLYSHLILYEVSVLMKIYVAS